MITLMKRTAIALAAAVTFVAGAANAVTVIDTTTIWNGTASISAFGETDTATYGQTFTAPLSDTRLDSFTFFVNDFVNNPDVVDFEAFVMAWDGAKAAGPILFQSAAMSTTNNGGSDGFEAITINTGGVVLTAGAEYVAFFSASNLFDGLIGRSAWGFVSDAVYADGTFIFYNNGNDFGLLTTSPWANFAVADLAFVMTFSSVQSSSVPEPGTLALLGAGLAGLGLLARRRKAA